MVSPDALESLEETLAILSDPVAMEQIRESEKLLAAGEPTTSLAAREELRQANAFVLRIAVEERWTHRLVRRYKRRPFPALTTPVRAERLIDYWSEGTARNALSWGLDDILSELAECATNQPLDL